MTNLKGIFYIFVILMPFVYGEEAGTSLVNCAACLSVETEIDNYSCKVNCQVLDSQNGIYEIIYYSSRR